MYEVYRDGEPTKLLFFSELNATLWINTHCKDGACYSVRPYKEGEHESS